MIDQRKNFLHHDKSKVASTIREILFGLEDGMVSTLGAVSGVAAGSQSHQTVLLAGFVIIAVESISMGIGSYLSNKSEADIAERKISEEKYEIVNFTKEEKKILANIYLRDGWPKALAKEMASAATQNKKLMLKEMSVHEMHVFPNASQDSIRRGLFMFFSYIIGGYIPLSAYLFFPIDQAVYFSIILALFALFALGAVTTRYTKKPWLSAGLRTLLLGSVALVVGLAAGRFFGNF